MKLDCPVMARRGSKVQRRRGDRRRRTLECGTVAVKSLCALPAVWSARTHRFDVQGSKQRLPAPPQCGAMDAARRQAGLRYDCRVTLCRALPRKVIAAQFPLAVN